ncbi:hypothetical protein [Pantoea ananatis]|uniref:tail fiber/spike domain-containing protein n=1 Tax=Pantoea ananas TaxID=553 RepID=UPI0002323308|nr:hypothetical protein [Pantoea ananatis]AER33585.1 hypothetical protein PAGR_g3093 [Pantoea ananatis PA13]
MSISDTANAKRYASIAEASAAQCALYTEEARNSPQYASDAKQSAEAAEAAQAQSATNAQQALQAASGASQNAATATQAAATAVTASNSASVSASSAATSASQAQSAASEVTAELSKTVRATDISLSALPDAATRAGKLISFNDSGDVIASVPASGSATEVYEELAKSTGASLVGYGAGTLADVGDKVGVQISGGLTFTGGGTLTSIRDFIFYPANNTWYYWTGTFNKTVVAGSDPLSDSGWKAAGDAQLRAELASATGYTLLPSMQIQQWKSVGDIRGWGAVCDGVTDDIAAITQAISDTGGKILVPGNIFVSTHILFLNKTNPVITFANQATVTINTSFTFADSYRGIIVFDGCADPKSDSVRFTGAKLDKFNGGVDPIEDGDAGIEYMNCTGLCYTINPCGKDVKTWGVIHINVENYLITDPNLKNCQVQSGIGGTGVKKGTVINPLIDKCGLAGWENETVNSNEISEMIGGIITGCTKAVAIINQVTDTLVSGGQALNCFNGVSIERAPSTATTIPTNITVRGFKATSCKNCYTLSYVNDVTLDSVEAVRDDTEFFSRTSTYDRVYRFSGGIAYSPTKEGNTAPPVGSVIEFDNGVQYTIATIEANITDPQFGQLYGFTCTTALTSDCLRRSFSRYVEVVSVMRAVVMYDGTGNIVKNSTFKDVTDLIVHYGSPSRFQWQGSNFAKGVARYFTQGSSGSATGSVVIDVHNCDNVGSFNDVTKFAPTFKTMRTFSFKGGTTHDQTEITNAFPVNDGFVSGIKCAINSGQTTTGTIVFKLNGNNSITSFSGNPLRASVTLATPIGISGAATAQLTDTVGDLIASGYAIELWGIYK